MDVDNENVNQPRATNVALKCDNCSSWFQDDEVTKLNNTILDTEVYIWDALAFIYGVSWTSIENYKSKKITEFLKTQDDLKFCSRCASLLKDNYISHSKFEHSSDSSSVVQLLKEFRDYQINSTGKHIDVQFLSHNVGETDFKEDLSEDFFSEDLEEDQFQPEDFVSDDLEKDVVQSEDLIETKYEPPSISDCNFPDGNTCYISSEEIESSSYRILNLRSKRQIVIKTEKLTPEEIIQYTNRTKARVKRNSTKKQKKATNLLKNLGNDQKVENKDNVTEMPSPDEKTIKAVAKKPKYLPQSNTRQIVCDICGKTVRMKYMKMHTLRAHATEEEQNEWKIQCDLCEAMLFPSAMRSHMNFIHKKLPPVKCKVCGKVCGNKITLKQHMLVVHINSYTREKCELCNKMIQENCMKQHLKHVHGDRERKFCCDICPHKSYTKGDLGQHRLSHSDVKRHVCDECGQAFKYSSALGKHMQTHRELAEKGAWAFTCDICEGRKFKHSISLKKHINKIHKKDRKIFECSVCSKRLSTSCRLREHENMHKEKPGFKPRVRNKVPGYIKGVISNDDTLTVESTHKSIPPTEAMD